MSVNQDFSLATYEDGILTIAMQPPTAIGGMSLQFTMTKRFGSPVPILLKSMSSGFYGVSGMNIINSGQGIFSVSLYASETSGLPFGNYAYQVIRTDSGSATGVSLGYRLCD